MFTPGTVKPLIAEMETLGLEAISVTIKKDRGDWHVEVVAHREPDPEQLITIDVTKPE